VRSVKKYIIPKWGQFSHGSFKKEDNGFDTILFNPIYHIWPVSKKKIVLWPNTSKAGGGDNCPFVHFGSLAPVTFSMANKNRGRPGVLRSPLHPVSNLNINLVWVFKKRPDPWPTLYFLAFTFPSHYPPWPPTLSSFFSIRQHHG